MNKWHNGQKMFHTMRPSERILSVLASLALVFFVWDWLWLSPSDANRVDLIAREEAAKTSLSKLNARKALLDRLAHSGPSAILKSELQSLRDQIFELDQQLEALSVGLIASDKVPALLQSVLLNMHGLQVVSLKTLPTEAILYDGKSSLSNEKKLSIELFRHGFELIFEGEFDNTLAFLKGLEKNERQFYWDELTYEIKKSPSARIELTVFILSTGEGVFDG